MTKADFLARVRDEAPRSLARELLLSEQIALFPDSARYSAFRERVAREIDDTEFVAVAGSGNWLYSMNPEKQFRPLNQTSDVDVAVVSPTMFHSLWEEMRRFHQEK